VADGDVCPAAEVEKNAQELLRKKSGGSPQYLTKYSSDWGQKVITRAWKLGDELWTKYDEKF
jgi:hypothetical protein